jgi:uncharacterized protein (UPF0335 family)
LQAEIETQNLINEDFTKLVDTFKNLEGVEFKVMETMFNYKKLDRLEQQEESRGICQEYKQGVTDPSRIVARMERSTMGRKKKR